MPRLLLTLLLATIAAPLAHAAVAVAQPDVRLVEAHPRIFLNPTELAALAARCTGPMAREYAVAKAFADTTVRTGIVRGNSGIWAVPNDMLTCGLVYLIERQLGHACRPYADVIIREWGDGRKIANKDDSPFGYYAIAYDWIYDALDANQRRTYGEALGTWLTWFTSEAAISLKYGDWEYNQTWGPYHLNIMHSRDAITQKLMISLAIAGAGTSHQAQAEQFLKSWATRVPAECIPAFDAVGGVWAESHGHGSYGPITVVPYCFEAWRSATGQNLFTAGKSWGFLPEMSRWLTYLRVPYVDRHAYIDDGGGDRFSGFANSAPLVAKDLHDPLAQWQANQAAAEGVFDALPWIRLLFDPTQPAKSPAELKLPLAYLFAGVGHVFMRSAWADPNATWAFFGAGPHIAGHQHDDEGHFLISRQGGLVSKGGGGGRNDDDFYWGGSLVFNLVTIFDPAEKFRRAEHNENDGGLLRHVYEDHRIERGRITAYRNSDAFTYSAADLTVGYNPQKAKEVTRQFLYLRGRPGMDEFFVVFDRVESTKPNFAKHFMLHIPEEPTLSGKATVLVPGHVSQNSGDGLISTWLSRPDDFGPSAPVLSKGRSRMFMKTVLPMRTTITKRGGEGYRNWGHPLEPTAQYDHTGPDRGKPPFCDWRLEVAAPEASRVLFLHVFQVCDEATAAMVPVKLVGTDPMLQLEIGSGQQVWKVSLAPGGELAGSVTPPRGRKAEAFPSTVESAPEYQAWQDATAPPGAKGAKPKPAPRSEPPPPPANPAPASAPVPVPARLRPLPEAATAWGDKLLARVRELCAQQHGPIFVMESMRGQVTVEAVEPDGTMNLRVDGGVLGSSWSKLTDADRLMLCLAVRRKSEPDDMALSAFMLLCVGRNGEAEEVLGSLPEAQAASVRKSFAAP